MPEKIVVITGASSGIGEALALRLGTRGDRLVLAARREALLKKVAAHSEARAIGVVTDVTRKAEVEELRDRALQEFGHVDVWINNAGRGINKHFEELTEEDIRGTIDIVLMSAVYGMQAILPHFKERGEGHIINVSSFLGRVPIATYRSIYSAAKSALNSLSANLRMDLRSKYPNIHVSVVLPGIVDTPFHEIAGPRLTVRAGGFIGNTKVESADEVAVKIVSLMDHPLAELYTNPGSPDLQSIYFKDVSAFEDNFAARQTSER